MKLVILWVCLVEQQIRFWAFCCLASPACYSPWLWCITSINSI